MKKILLISLIFTTLAPAQKGRPQRTVTITAGGTGDVITGTPSPALAAYTDLSSANPPMDVIFTATADNTTNVTINLNGLGAVPVVKLAGGVSTALVANDIRNKQPVILRYNATDANFKMVSPTGNAAAGGSAAYSRPYTCSMSNGPLRICEFRVTTAEGSYQTSVAGATTATDLISFRTDGTAGEKAGILFRMPITPTSWTVNVTVYTSVTTTTVFTARRSCSAAGVAPAAENNGATGTLTTPTVGRLYSIPITMTIGTCAAGDFVSVIVDQDAVAVDIVGIDYVIQ